MGRHCTLAVLLVLWFISIVHGAFVLTTQCVHTFRDPRYRIENEVSFFSFDTVTGQVSVLARVLTDMDGVDVWYPMIDRELQRLFTITRKNGTEIYMLNALDLSTGVMSSTEIKGMTESRRVSYDSKNKRIYSLTGAPNQKPTLGFVNIYTSSYTLVSRPVYPDYTLYPSHTQFDSSRNIYWYSPNSIVCGNKNPLIIPQCVTGLDPTTGKVLKAFNLGMRDIYAMEIFQDTYHLCYEAVMVYPTPNYLQVATLDVNSGVVSPICNFTYLKRGGLRTPGTFGFSAQNKRQYYYLSWWDQSTTEQFFGIVDLETCTEAKISLASAFQQEWKKCEDFGFGWRGIVQLT